MIDRFPTERNFQGDLSKDVFPSAIKASKNSLPDKRKK